MHRTLTKFVAASVALLSVTAPAFADVAEDNAARERQTRVVQYDDLDLSSPRGRERLETRIRSAANSACGFWSAQTLTEKKVAQQCRAAAVERTRTEVAAAVRNAAARYAARDAE